MELPDGVLAYRFLASANISDHHKQLVRATLPELSYQKMKEQLLKVFNDPSVFSSDADIKNESSIKVEPTFQGYVFQEHSYYAQSNPRFMNSFRARGRGALGTPKNKGWQSFQSQKVNDTKRRQRHNPPDKDGKVSRCYNCGSILHWARNCPYHEESKPSCKDEVRIQFYMEEVLQTLVGETLSMAILDSGCTETVCGNTWLECFIETLSNEEKELVTTEPSLILNLEMGRCSLPIRLSKYQQKLLERRFSL